MKAKLGEKREDRAEELRRKIALIQEMRDPRHYRPGDSGRFVEQKDAEDLLELLEKRLEENKP